MSWLVRFPFQSLLRIPLMLVSLGSEWCCLTLVCNAGCDSFQAGFLITHKLALPPVKVGHSNIVPGRGLRPRRRFLLPSITTICGADQATASFLVIPRSYFCTCINIKCIIHFNHWNMFTIKPLCDMCLCWDVSCNTNIAPRYEWTMCKLMFQTFLVRGCGGDFALKLIESSSSTWSFSVGVCCLPVSVSWS